MNEFFTKTLREYRDMISTHRFLILFLSLLSLLSLVDIPGSSAIRLPVYAKWIYLLFTSVFKGMLVFTLLSPLMRRRWGMVLVWVAISAFGLLSLTNAISYRYYGIGLSRKLMLVLAQTTPAEATGFLPGLWQNVCNLLKSPTFYITVLGIGILAYSIRFLTEKTFARIALSMATVGLCLFGVFCLSFSFGRTAHFMTLRLPKYGVEIWKNQKKYEELVKKKRPLPYAESVSSRHLATTVVVVIGESAHRRHHSLYGYPLPTTPALDSLRDSLVIFSDVIGSSTGTAGNMERILSFKEDDRVWGDGLDYPLVVDLFNRMGYRTYWLSNQERTGSVSNTSGVMAMNADRIEYVGAEDSEDALNMKYDEVLLPRLEEALKAGQDNRMVFLHFLGSHVEYRSRYPEKFDCFSAEDEKECFKFPWLDEKMAKRRAQYDNSIRYTDYLLGHIIRNIRSLTAPALMIYLSDHGEEVYDYSAYTGRNRNTVQVPFIIYANGPYKTGNPEMMERLRSAADRPMSTANLVHLLISLTGGEYRLYDPALDVSSSQFAGRVRYVDEEPWTQE